MKNAILVLFLFGILLFAGCAGQQPPSSEQPVGEQPAAPQPEQPKAPAAKETIKLGAILPLTGTLANIGEGMRDAMLLAVEEVNKAGGVNGKEIELFIEDTGCDPANAVPAVNKLISINRVIAIAGPTCSGESFATAPMINENKIVTVSPSATNARLTTEGGDYWFRISPSDALQGKLAAKYARETLGARRAAVLYLNNDWAVGLRDVFKAGFVERGGEIAAEESMEADTTDVRTQVTKIRSLNADIIYMPCFPKECAVALRQLSELGVRAKVLGADGADDPKTLAEIGAAAEGFIITVPSGAGEAFNSRFRDRYGKDAGAYAAQSYDAVMLLADALKNAGESGEAMKNYLYTVQYIGVTGTIAFDSNGDPTSAKYDLKRWQNGAFVLLEQVTP